MLIWSWELSSVFCLCSLDLNQSSYSTTAVVFPYFKLFKSTLSDKSWSSVFNNGLGATVPDGVLLSLLSVTIQRGEAKTDDKTK